MRSISQHTPEFSAVQNQTKYYQALRAEQFGPPSAPARSIRTSSRRHEIRPPSHIPPSAPTAKAQIATIAPDWSESPAAHSPHDDPAHADPPGELDLRRRKSGDLRRRAAQTCVERSHWLDASDRAVILAIYRDGMTIARLAELGAIQRTPHDPRREPALNGGPESIESPSDRSRALRRRVKRLTARLLSPRFAFVASFLEPADQSERKRLGLPCWPPLRREIAKRCVIRGWSLRRAAHDLAISFHVVRREMAAVQSIYESRSGA